MFLCCSSFIYGHLRGHSLANGFAGTETEGRGSKRAGIEGCLLSSRYIDMTIETVGGESCFATKSPFLRPTGSLKCFNLIQPHTTLAQLNECSMMFYATLCAAHCRSFPYSNTEPTYTEPTWIDLLRSYQKRIHFQITRIHRCTVIC